MMVSKGKRPTHISTGFGGNIHVGFRDEHLEPVLYLVVSERRERYSNSNVKVERRASQWREHYRVHK
jgi:hypothetical protein